MTPQTTQEIEPERLKRASENLKRIEKAIAPFAPKEKSRAQPTAGKWRETTTWSPLDRQHVCSDDHP